MRSMVKVMADQTPNEEANIGKFILRLCAAGAWFVVFWLVRFRTMGMDISEIMRNVLAVMSLGMGMLTLFWAFFNKSDDKPKEGDD